MKYVIIVPDGMSDRPLDQLDGKTPLEISDTPNMDKVVSMGKLGRVRTVPEDAAPGSDVAIMSLLGYDPAEFHPGRAALEAANLGINISEGDAVFRCNFVTVSEGKMEDYSAGQIKSEEAAILIDFLNEKLGSETISFHPGMGYRHIMHVKGGALAAAECVPPHDIVGKKISKHLPKGKAAGMLSDLMERSNGFLADHEVNRVRVDLGENPANMIWLWGMGRTPHMPSFERQFGLDGAVISAVDLVKGIAKIIGWDRISVQGANAMLDTNYEGKGDAAIEAISTHDIVFVHIEAPDEASHAGNIDAKIEVIHEIDAHIVGPMTRRLMEEEEYRLMVLPDHATPIELRTHSSEPVPFALCGSNVVSDQQEIFTERTAEESELIIDPGHELMEYFLSGRA